MLTEICQYLRNWFDRTSDGTRLPTWTGDIEIANGELVGFADRLLPGQYFRILDSKLNNGVWQYGVDFLKDETFSGTVQEMAVPEVVVQAAESWKAYREKYGEVLDSPFSSENYFGYSWTKDSKAVNGSSGSGIPDSIASMLAPWRKI